MRFYRRVECPPQPNASVAVSKKKLTAVSQCSSQGHTVVPQTGTKVCNADEKGSGVNEGQTDDNNQIDLKALLGAIQEINWQTDTPPSPVNTRGQTLRLQASDLPLADKSFLVGHFKVDLTETNNTVELVRGEGESLQLASFTTKFCEDAALEKCDKEYDIKLPGFNASFWGEVKKGNASAKLTIPASAFPAEDQAFSIGCSRKPTPTTPGATVRSELGQRAAVKPSTCKVLVTIKAAISGVAAVSAVQPVAAAATVAFITEGLPVRTQKKSESSSSQHVVAKCELNPDNNKEQPSPPTVELSKDQLSAKLQCTGQGNKVVPQKTTDVCTSEKEDATVEECEKRTNAKHITLEALLEAGSPIHWANAALSPPPDSGEEWSLELHESQLPLSDKTFFIGCKKQGDDENPGCKLTVFIKAKASSAEKNVVACAYGKDSNTDQPLQVELTKENNTLELLCGKEGSVRPEAYQTTFCEDADMKTCGISYSELLPKFDKSWWAEGSPAQTTAKLIIPPTDFPAEDMTFYMGCSAGEASPEEQKLLASENVEQPASKVPACRVLVTVKAKAMSSLAQPTFQTAVVASVLTACFSVVV
ncbi:SAG-related sequence [Besnoitia besnoiti]|uniref:SAG-related sequence n=1 Tax=Besnoitia besnoiti TaxID=94643 RepID=A0A2A9ME65_BESBE|nr:SAG-related sequence [Besnoitia besnoiti]PFH36169.1 SAG-related sequence [Besnoitia besnoiti]